MSSPMDPILDQIEKLLQDIEKNLQNASLTEAVPPDLQERLNALKQNLEFLERVDTKAMEIAGITPEDIDDTLMKITQGNNRHDKELQERIRRLQLQAMLLEANLIRLIYPTKTSQEKLTQVATETSQTTPEEKKEIKKKYKNLKRGGSSWQKL